MAPDDGQRIQVSYLTLRRLVGVLGVSLPVVVALWGFDLRRRARLQPSISDYCNSGTPLERTLHFAAALCLFLVLACIALIGLYYAFLEGTAVRALGPVFWLESIALWAFGVSWFVKGETLWKDPVTPSE